MPISLSRYARNASDDGQIIAIANNGTSIEDVQNSSAALADETAAIDEAALADNYPNPFNAPELVQDEIQLSAEGTGTVANKTYMDNFVAPTAALVQAETPATIDGGRRIHNDLVLTSTSMVISARSPDIGQITPGESPAPESARV